MAMLKRFSGFFIIALMLSALGCGSTPQQSSTGQYIDDSAITTKVKTAIFNEPSLKVNQISVETYKNVVLLSGFVGSSAQITRAVDLARSVQGVLSVSNNLMVK